MRIAFVGAGKMASSLIAGMVAMGIDGGRISASARRLEQRELLKSRYGVDVHSNASESVVGADVVILSVKPQLAGSTCREIAPNLSDDALIVSIMAGVPISSLLAWLNSSRSSVRPIVRCMPNTPASIGLGMTALYADAAVSSAQKECTYKLMSAVGRAIWVGEECQFDAITALSGSGPAYAYLLMEAMIDAGRALGLPTELAEVLTRQTILGAAHLATDQGLALGELRRQVTSPGGTTEAAINLLQENGFNSLMERAVHAAALRSAELTFNVSVASSPS